MFDYYFGLVKGLMQTVVDFEDNDELTVRNEQIRHVRRAPNGVLIFVKWYPVIGTTKVHKAPKPPELEIVYYNDKASSWFPRGIRTYFQAKVHGELMPTMVYEGFMTFQQVKAKCRELYL